jgi:hypothetical protein
MYLAIVETKNNRIHKVQPYDLQADADDHVARSGGFVAQEPDTGHMAYWVVDEEAKTITHDSSTETADKAAYDAQAYARSRKAEYDKLNQFEMQFDDQRDGTTTWVDAINGIKEKYPK